MEKFYLTESSCQTKKLGKIFSKEFLKKGPFKKAAVLGLEGELGSGKTVFLQGFAKGLGIEERITSPTFVIMKKFKTQTAGRKRKNKNFYHFDCYRIEEPEEVLRLGFDKIILNSENIVAVEWASRIKKIMPEETVWIGFKFVEKNKRQISIN